MPSRLHHYPHAVYETHDNGGRPFRVCVSDNDGAVTVFLVDHDGGNRRTDANTPVVWSCPQPARVFIGQQHGEDVVDPVWARGNSILVQMSEHRHCFIGDTVYEFDSPEPITEYYSQVGNSDVPYPVAVSATKVFFMLDRRLASRHKLSNDTPLWDAYSQFYEWRENESEPFEGVMQVHERR